MLLLDTCWNYFKQNCNSFFRQSDASRLLSSAWKYIERKLTLSISNILKPTPFQFISSQIILRNPGFDTVSKNIVLSKCLFSFIFSCKAEHTALDAKKTEERNNFEFEIHFKWPYSFSMDKIALNTSWKVLHYKEGVWEGLSLVMFIVSSCCFWNHCLIPFGLISVLIYWKFYLTCQSEFCHSLVGAATTASENEICTIFCVLLCAKFWDISLRKDKGENEKKLKSYKYILSLIYAFRF